MHHLSLSPVCLAYLLKQVYQQLDSRAGACLHINPEMSLKGMMHHKIIRIFYLATSLRILLDLEVLAIWMVMMRVINKNNITVQANSLNPGYSGSVV